MSFWQELKASGKPIVGLSPMDGVTDYPFRYMVAKYSQPDLLYTEFVNVDALHYARDTDRWERVTRALTPVKGFRSKNIAQIFGKDPELFVEAVKLVEELGFDGVDINMGCPAKKVSENGAGAGLIRTPKLAQEIVLAVKEVTSLPVSVKTRVGVESVKEMEDWIVALMEVKPETIALHGRTLRQMYTGKADWLAIQRAGEIVHQMGGILLGNGDVKEFVEIEEKVNKFGIDGVLVGRASMGNPGVLSGMQVDKRQRLKWMLEHTQKFMEFYQDTSEKWFLPMRKHLAWYAKGFEGASEMRQKLVRCSSLEEVKYVLGV